MELKDIPRSRLRPKGIWILPDGKYYKEPTLLETANEYTKGLTKHFWKLFLDQWPWEPDQLITDPEDGFSWNIRHVHWGFKFGRVYSDPLNNTYLGVTIEDQEGGLYYGLLDIVKRVPKNER